MPRKKTPKKKEQIDYRERSIKVNDRFYFERAPDCWKLYEYSPDIDTPKRIRFYSTLIDVCDAIIDKSLDKVYTLETLMESIDAAHNQIIEVLTGYTFTNEEIETAIKGE